MDYLHLFLEFFKIGLFALGGGPATLPFLSELARSNYGWFTEEQLTNMIAVSESTPGPLGVNMATYAGYSAAGVLGGIVATLSLVLPSIIVILIIARFLQAFKDNKYVKNVFSGIRPAVAALIAVAIFGIFRATLFAGDRFSVLGYSFGLDLKLLILATVIFVLLQFKKLSRLHPALWLLVGCIAGIVFKM